MKTISIPQTSEAMERLDTDSCVDGDLLEFEISDQEFNSLVSCGLLPKLNKSLGILIDEYEDECISSKQIEKSIEILTEFSEVIEQPVFNKILYSFKNARDCKTAIFFFF